MNLVLLLIGTPANHCFLNFTCALNNYVSCCYGSKFAVVQLVAVQNLHVELETPK